MCVQTSESSNARTNTLDVFLCFSRSLMTQNNFIGEPKCSATDITDMHKHVRFKLIFFRSYQNPLWASIPYPSGGQWVVAGEAQGGRRGKCGDYVTLPHHNVPIPVTLWSPWLHFLTIRCISTPGPPTSEKSEHAPQVRTYNNSHFPQHLHNSSTFPYLTVSTPTSPSSSWWQPNWGPPRSPSHFLQTLTNLHWWTQR
jgi:hypothetical protein